MFVLAGKIKKMIEKIVSERSEGNVVKAETTKAKLALRGIDARNFNDMSSDDPAIISKLEVIAREFGIKL